MIRVDVHQRLVRTARKLELTAEAERVLRLVSEQFGEQHRHAGLGLRKIGRYSYEARIGLHWRIVFIKETDRLTAYDIMDHGEVRVWLTGGQNDPVLQDDVHKIAAFEWC